MAYPQCMIRRFSPASVRGLANRLLGAAIRYDGPYETWQFARSRTIGYNQMDILNRVANATSRVLRGDAEYEQDGQAFSGPPPPSHALAALMLGAALEDGHLSVVDLGGGLGSHFLRWRHQLEALPEIRWSVVEQAHYVDEGTRLLEGVLSISFVTSIDQVRDSMPNVVLASSVLQYLPDPLTTLDGLVSLNPRLIVIDRTPFSCDDAARILTQHVPSRLGGGSYPLWSLSRSAIYLLFEQDYHLLWEFPSPDAPIKIRGLGASYGGSVWLRNN